MKDELFISIIVPVYNSEKYLRECLESVIHQSYKKLDILLINDGSKDSSLDICKQFEKKDSRVRVISKENEGVSATRNRGIAEAQGDWITFVDSDDIIDKDYIKELTMDLSDDLDICFVNTTKKVDELNSKKNNESVAVYLDRTRFRQFEKGLLNKYAVKTDIHLTSACAKLYNKRFLLENHIYFPENLVKSEDATFNLYAFHYARQGKHSEKALYYYRMNKESAIHKYDHNVVNTYRKHLQIILDFYKGKEYEGFFQDFSVRVFFDFIYCIFNKFCHADNRDDYKKRRQEFLDVLHQDPFYKNIQEVQVNKFSFPEKVFAFCIRKELFGILNIATRLAQFVR